MQNENTTYAIRLPVSVIKRLKEIAKAKYLPPTVMARAWLMQRLDTERMNEKSAVGEEFAHTTPTADDTPSGAIATTPTTGMGASTAAPNRCGVAHERRT